MPTYHIPDFIKNKMGTQIIGYILDIEERDVIKLISNDYTLTECKQKILDQFVTLVRTIISKNIDCSDAYAAVYYEIRNIVLPNQTHILNYWNAQAGGQDPVLNESDKVAYSISMLALEKYPLFLLKMPTLDHFHEINDYIFCVSDPKSDVYLNIFDDKMFQRFFPERQDDAFNTSGYFSASCGTSGTVQLSVFPNNIISAAITLCHMEQNMSKMSLCSKISSIVNVCRGAIRGETTNMPFIMLFHNCILPPDITFNIVNCNIASYNMAVEKYMPHDTRPGRISIDGNTCINGFMVTGSYQYEVKIGKNEFESKYNEFESKYIDDAWQLLDSHISRISEKIRLAFALAIDRDLPVGIDLGCILLFNPFNPPGRILWNPKPTHLGKEHICTEAELEKIGCWYRRLCEVDTSSIDVGIRRINLATSPGRNPIDSFVDAVIALENLFGGPSETRFRISASIAKLLEHDPQKRLAMQKRVSKCYDARSAIIHGSKFSKSDIFTLRNECIQIALRSLGKLVEHRQNLIADTDRSKTILLE